METSTILAIIAFAIGLPAALAAAYGVLAAVRNRGRLDQLTDQLTIMATTNGELRDSLQFERSERQRQEQQCQLQVAELVGRVDTLQGETVTRLIDSIAQAMATNQRELITHLSESVLKAVTDAVHLAINRPDRRSVPSPEEPT